jgi:hypothetical protein
MIAQSRRQFLRTGLAFLAAPAIVRASSLMPVKSLLGLREEGFVFSGFFSSVPLDELTDMSALIDRMVAEVYRVDGLHLR